MGLWTTPLLRRMKGWIVMFVKPIIEPLEPRLMLAAVSGLVLVNADTGQDIMPLAGRSTINLATLPTRNLNIRADATADTLSIRFGLDRKTIGTDNLAPFSLAGDDNAGHYAPWTPSVRSHTLSATPFAQPNAKGRSGRQRAITLKVIDKPASSPTPAPTPPPSTAPAGPVVIANRQNETISGLTGPVTLQNCTNITLRDCNIAPVNGIGDTDAIRLIDCTGCKVVNNIVTPKRAGRDGISIEGGSDNLVQGNTISYAGNSIYALSSANIRIIGNYSFNPVGPADPRGHDVILDKCPSGEIAFNYCNAAQNGAAMKPAVEDRISAYRSQNIAIHDNYAVGGWSKSGTGIIVDGADCANITIRNNTLIRTGQVGISVAAGINVTIDGNKILDTNLRSQFPDAGNVGISVWNQSSTPSHDITISNNIISNRWPGGHYNDYWDGGNSGPVTKTNNLTADPARKLLTPESTKLPPPPTPPKPYAG